MLRSHFTHFTNLSTERQKLGFCSFPDSISLHHGLIIRHRLTCTQDRNTNAAIGRSPRSAASRPARAPAPSSSGVPSPRARALALLPAHLRPRTSDKHEGAVLADAPSGHNPQGVEALVVLVQVAEGQGGLAFSEEHLGPLGLLHQHI